MKTELYGVRDGKNSRAPGRDQAATCARLDRSCRAAGEMRAAIAAIPLRSARPKTQLDTDWSPAGPIPAIPGLHSEVIAATRLSLPHAPSAIPVRPSGAFGTRLPLSPSGGAAFPIRSPSPPIICALQQD